MSDWDWGRYPKSAKRPPPKHGIRVRKIGATWWGQRWIDALEKLSRDYLNRLGRGRTYARAGRVHDLDVAPGLVSARVTGSRPTPYKVTLSVAALSSQAWDRAIAEMAKQALFAAELLAGHMPREIDSAFRADGRSLFPSKARDIETDCSCPDWANPCKHVAAVHYVLGEAFDKDPFLLFELRGRSREQVLEALRKLRAGPDADTAHEAAGSAPVAAASLAGMTVNDYERPPTPLGRLRLRVEPPLSPAAVLRQLGAPPAWSIEQSPADLLGPLYQAAGALAREMALGPVEPRKDFGRPVEP